MLIPTDQYKNPAKNFALTKYSIQIFFWKDKLME